MTFKETETKIEVDDEAPAPTVDLTQINTLHELLALAIGDFEKVLADDRYAINMNTWHEPGEDGDDRCHVCLAGSVLAKTVQVDRDVSLDDSSEGYRIWADEPFATRLYALNELRIGRVANAWRFLHCRGSYVSVPEFVEVAHLKWCTRIPPHAAHACTPRDGRALLKIMKSLHADLVEAGL